MLVENKTNALSRTEDFLHMPTTLRISIMIVTISSSSPPPPPPPPPDHCHHQIIIIVITRHHYNDHDHSHCRWYCHLQSHSVLYARRRRFATLVKDFIQVSIMAATPTTTYWVSFKLPLNRWGSGIEIILLQSILFNFGEPFQPCSVTGEQYFLSLPVPDIATSALFSPQDL